MTTPNHGDPAQSPKKALWGCSVEFPRQAGPPAPLPKGVCQTGRAGICREGGGGIRCVLREGNVLSTQLRWMALQGTAAAAAGSVSFPFSSPNQACGLGINPSPGMLCTGAGVWKSCREREQSITFTHLCGCRTPLNPCGTLKKNPKNHKGKDGTEFCTNNLKTPVPFKEEEEEAGAWSGFFFFPLFLYRVITPSKLHTL